MLSSSVFLFRQVRAETAESEEAKDAATATAQQQQETEDGGGAAAASAAAAVDEGGRLEELKEGLPSGACSPLSPRSEARLGGSRRAAIAQG